VSYVGGWAQLPKKGRSGEMVPRRAGIGRHRNFTTPMPENEVGLTESQETLLTAVQAHPAWVETMKDPDPVPAPKDCADGEI
jgi:hypothetical protein